MLYFLLFVCISICYPINSSQVREIVPATIICQSKTVNNQLNESMWKAIKDNDLPGLQELFAGDPIPNINAPDSTSYRGYTPLVYVIYSNPDLVEFLVSQGADVNAKTGAGQTPLRASIENGYTDTAQFLINHGARFEQKELNEALMQAAQWQRPHTVKFLIKHGARVNAKLNDGSTALMHAAQSETASGPDIVDLLIAAGAHIYARDKFKRTALHYAAAKGNFVIAKLLIDHGAELNARNNNGFTPLMLAAWNGKTEVVKVLVFAGADPYMVNEKDDNKTAFDYARDKQVIENAIQEGEKIRNFYLGQVKMEISEQKSLASDVAGIISEYSHGPKIQKRKRKTTEEEPEPQKKQK